MAKVGINKNMINNMYKPKLLVVQYVKLLNIDDYEI